MSPIKIDHVLPSTAAVALVTVVQVHSQKGLENCTKKRFELYQKKVQ